MQVQLLFTGLACLAAIVAAGCAVWNTSRTARWRDTDEGRAVTGKIEALSGRVGIIEAAQKTMPTQASVAALTADVQSVKGSVKDVQRGIDRIEGHFIKKGIGE